MRHLVIAFDGTWEAPDNDFSDGNQNTHVSRLVNHINIQTLDGIEQHHFYQPGVGTHFWDRYRGGVFGWGLSEKILQAYQWLVREYRFGDRVFLIGYSRGAYAARSLSGLIDRVGLLKTVHIENVEEAYSIYRRSQRRKANEFKRRFSDAIDIEAIAVWDTVGSLGIPLKSFQGLNRHLWQFHDTKLASNVRNGFHALAIDEHRPDFKPTLWCPDNNLQRIEQRWFAGSHSDIGGGRSESGLSAFSYHWIESELTKLGLSIAPTEFTSSHFTPFDSFNEFLAGVYDLFRDRHYRVLGSIQTGREVLDPSVFHLIEKREYQPKNRVESFLKPIEGIVGEIGMVAESGVRPEVGHRDLRSYSVPGSDLWSDPALTPM